MSNTVLKKSGRASCRTPLNDHGTSATSGQRPRLRTTCEISDLANKVVDASRVWLRPHGVSASKGAFLDEAVFELSRRLMRENPEFKLPPGLELPMPQ